MADPNNIGNGSEPAGYSSGSLDIDDNQSVSFYSSQSGQYPVENLEVHDPNAVNHSNQILHPLGNSFKFSRRKAMVVSLVITMIVIIITAVAMLFLVKYSSKPEDASKLPKQQDVTLKDAQDSVIPKELQGAEQSLLVNGDVVTRGSFKVSNGTSVSVLKLQQGATGDQTITLPNGSGTICLDNNNCGYTNLADFTGLQGQVSSLQSIVSALSQVQVPAAGVDSLNSQKGAVSIQGSLNQISVTTSNGVLTLSTPQDLDANANVQFGSLAVSQTGEIRANKLIQTGAGNSINIDAGNDFITFTAGGRVFQLPNSGGASQTICTTGASCASGGGTAVLLASGSVQNESDPSASIFINDTGGGNLLQLQTGGVDKLVVANNGNTTVGGSLTVSSLGNGFVKSTAGALSVVSSISLTSDVTNTLPVSNGGTGLNTIPANGVLVGNGVSPVSSVVAGGTGLCLMSTAGAPSFQACPGSGGVTSLNGQAGALTVVGTANQVNVNTASGTITLSTPQNIHVAATPTFAGLTLSGLGTGPVKASAGLLGTGNINLGSEVSGLLGVTLGGTGVSTTPSNGQLLIGNGTGYTLATLTAGAGVTITNGGGSITIAAPSAGSCAGCANQALSNLSGVALNTSLLTGSTTIDLGSNAAPFRDLYLGGSATNNFKFTGVATAARTITIPNASGTLAISASGNIALDVAGNLTITGQIPLANGGTGSNTAAGARTNLGAAASGANSDITSTTALNTITPSSTLTIGATGQILSLQGNGSTTVSAGSGANITTLGFAAPSGINTITFPALSGTVCVSSGNCATAGSAGGDLTGTYPNPTIAKLQGTTLNISGPTGGQVLIYNGTNGRWENHGITGDISLSETGTATIANNAVTSAKIADGTVTGTDIASSTVTNGNLVNSSLTVTAGTGLTGGGLVSLGSSTAAINVVYGSSAGSAVQGNVQITCASGTGNLTGGGNTITLGTGGSCNNISIVSNPTFSGPLTVGASGTQGAFVLYDGGAGVAANTGTLNVISSLGQDTTYTLPDPGAGTATICLSTGNCAGAGGGITGSGTTGKIAKFSGSGTIADSTISESGTTITLSGNMIIQGSNSLSLGTSSSLDGSLKFYNATGTHFVALQAPSTDPAADLSFKLPNSYGANGDCLQSNGSGGLSFTSCTGGAGGGVTSINAQTGVVSLANATAASGTITINDASTAQKGIAQFSSTNFSASLGTINTIQNIDSTATPTFAGLRLTGLGAGAVVSDGSGNLSSTQLDRNSSSYFSNSLTAANGGTGQSSYTTGDLLYASAATTLSKLAAVAAGQCLVSNGVGTAPSWSVCPGSGGVSSLNTFTGAVTVQGTTNQVIVNNNTGVITLSTPQDINTSSTPQFSGLGLTAGLTFSGVVTDITTGLNQDLTLDANGTGKTILSDAVDVAGLFSANGGIQTNGAGIATSNGALTLGSGNLTTTGTITSGLINGQTISAAANFTGTVAIQGANSLTLGTSSSLDGSVAFKNAAGTHTVSLQAPTTDPTANFTIKLPSAGPASAGDCLLSDASGNLYFASCPGSGGGTPVTSLDGLTGALTIANSSGLGSTVTIDDATTLAKGIASFSSSNFSVSSGAVSIKAGGVGSTEIADGSITGTDIGSNTVTNSNLVNSSVTVNAGTNLTGGGAVSLGGNITLNVASSPTFGGNVTVQGGTTTLGASGQQGSAIFYNGGAGVSAHTGTVQVIGTLGQDTTYTLPDPGASTATICLSTGNCAGAGGGITGSGTNGQVAYFNGSGTITSSANLLFNGTDVTVAGALSGNTLVSTVATGIAPLTVTSTTLVTNFNADLLDGQHGAYYQDAGNLNAGVVASARISGSYTGITGVGTISTGTWQGSAIADAYLQDNITVSALGTVDWAALNNYPAACAAGQAVTQLGDSITCTAFAAGSGSGNYIQNNTGPVQAGASFWIDGTGRADTKLQTPLLDTGTAVALNIGTTNATAINLNKNVVVAASQSLTLTGGNTASRPASPTEGMLYYDTSTKQLLTYANGKWQADRTPTTKIIAPSNASQTAKDSADVVLTGTGDQTLINTALSAAAGGKVYIMEGTVTVNGAINVPNNTTLAGAGYGTLIIVANSQGTSQIIIGNTDTTTGTGVTIQDLRLDGNRINQTTGSHTGIRFTGMGGGTGASARQGGKIMNIWANNAGFAGIYLNGSSNNVVSGTVTFNDDFGTLVGSNSNNNTFIGNVGQGNTTDGISLTTNSAYNTITGNTYQGNTNEGIMLNSAPNNTVTGNTVYGNGTVGIYVYTNSNTNVISGNKIHDNGGATTNEGIKVNASDSNTITGNNISDTSATSTNYAIDISISTSNTNYIAGNTLGSGSINDAGTGTIFGSQLNGSGALVLQDSSGINLNSATTIAASLTVTSAGNVAFQKGADYATTGTTNNVNLGTGALFRLTGASAQTITGIANGADGRMITLINAAGQSATIANNSASSTAANRIITGTGSNMTLASGASINLVYDSGASFWRVVGSTSAVGGGTYVNLQASTPGTADTGNFNITGSGIAATLQGSTSVLTPNLDVISAGTLSIGTTTATAINISKSGVTTAVQGALTVAQTTTFNGAVTFSGVATDITTGANEDLTIDANGTGKLMLNDSVVVAASQSLTITGGATGTRPASPTEGMLYYDTTTKQLLTYANGKWQADRSTATKIVAASNSSQALKDSADYVATGTGDQAQINAALTAAAGGKVYLAEGTYTINAAISIPNNTTLVGAGAGTLITIPNSFNASIKVLTNTDTATGTGITVSNLKLDGNKTNQTSGLQDGINFSHVGNVAASRQGVIVQNIWANNFNNVGIGLIYSDNSVASSNISNNNYYGIDVENSYNTSITANSMNQNTYGIYASTVGQVTVSGNTVYSGSNDGVKVSSSTAVTVTGNTSNSNAGNGFQIYNSTNVTVTGNNASGNTLSGVDLIWTNNSIVSSNMLSDNSGATKTDSVYISASNSNTIIGNYSTDSSCTTNCYAINIDNSSSTNYLANNNLGGGSINDAGTGTIYANQQNSNGYFALQSAATRLGIGTTAPSEMLNVYNGNLQVDYGNYKSNQLAAPGAPTVAVNATAGNLNGFYWYVVTYVTASGESNYGTVSANVHPVSQQVNLTAIPTGPSGIVTARKIYRGTSSGGPFKLVTTIADNTTTSYTDNIADASLTTIASNMNTTGGMYVVNGYGLINISTVSTNANTFVGMLTGNNGDHNTGLGYATLQSVTNGSYNTANGYYSLQSNTTGYDNTATGANSLKSNVDGYENTAIGSATLQSNTWGYDNTATGVYSLYANTGGYNNTASGAQSLTNNTTGAINTGAGVYSLSRNTTGSYNAALGGYTLNYNTTGDFNTAAGAQSLQSNTTGSYNTALGYRASSNDYNGTFATLGNLQYATAIGAYSQVQANNSIVLGSVDQPTKVGIGTTVPLNTFSVSPLDYQTGTATRTNGSSALIGTGTTWTSAMVGDLIVFADGTTNTVSAFTDATHITMGTTYTGTTDASPVNYRFHRPGFQVTSAGSAYVQNTDATAFQVLNSSGISTLTVNTAANTVALNGSVTVAASQSLTITGGATGTRPASPTEGMLYYDTTTKQLLTYANGKWQADRSTATKIVAASNSSQALKDSADYVATGTGDQAQINAALTAAAGGKVYLAEGTYTINAAISIPNNTTLVGAGAGTLITIPNSFNASINAITNTDTTTGTGVTVSNLQLDGNKANQASGVQKGIYLNGMGNGPGGTSRAGAIISNLKIVNFTDNGIMLNNSDNNDVSNNYLQNNTANDAVFLQSSNLNTIHGNFMQGNGSAVYLYSNSNNNKVFGNTSDISNYAGFTVSGSFENDFSQNIARDTANGSGFFLDGANRNTLTGNTVTGTTLYPGFWLYNGSSENALTGNVSSTNKEGIDLGSGTGTPSNNTITANIIKDSTSYGIFLGGNNNIVSNNTIQNSGGATDNNGITTLTGSSNTITANKISDTSATTTNYAINISNGTSNTNYLSDNTLGSGTINDAGTGTIYGGQVNSSGNFVIQPAGTIELMKNTNVTGNLAVTGTGSFTGGSVTVATSTATDDRLVVSVATGGAARFDGTITNADLTAARTWTLPNESGTICIVGSTSCLSGAGFVQFAPASVQADTSTNTSIFINKTGASGNIIDLQKSGVDLFIVNSTGAIQLGSTGNGITLSGSGGVTTGSFTLNGTARNTKTITMNAEYAGAVLDAASDTSCSAANNGTLTSGFTTTGTNSKPEGYYTWSSTQGTAQCYDVVVQVPLPSDFDGFTGTQSVNVWSSNTTNGTVVMDKNVNGTTDGTAYSTTLTPGSASTWTNQTFTFAGSYTSSNANQMLTLRIRMSSLSSAQVNLGRITLQYYSKF